MKTPCLSSLTPWSYFTVSSGASFPAVNYLRNLLDLELLTVFELLFVYFLLGLRTHPLWQLRTFTQSPWNPWRVFRALSGSPGHSSIQFLRYSPQFGLLAILSKSFSAGQQQNASLKRQAVGSVWTAYQLRWRKRHWLYSEDGFQGKAFGGGEYVSL